MDANPNDAAIVVRLSFVPRAGFTRAGAVDTEPITIAPHTMMTFEDVLTDAFHATSNTGGVAIVEAEDMAAVPIVTARTFNDTSGGTFASSSGHADLIDATGETWRTGRRLGGPDERRHRELRRQ